MSNNDFLFVISGMLSNLDMYNRYIKFPDFKTRCKTDGIHSPSYYKNQFYKYKNIYIKNLIEEHPELISEWHVEIREDEDFYIIAFTVENQEYRFHQKFSEMPKPLQSILATTCWEKRTPTCTYFHDEYPDTQDYEIFHRDDETIDIAMARIFNKIKNIISVLYGK